MVKMFITLEEAKKVLGKTESQLKDLAKQGLLREFRDGPRLMFKGDQVASLYETLNNPVASWNDVKPEDARKAESDENLPTDEKGRELEEDIEIEEYLEDLISGGNEIKALKIVSVYLKQMQILNGCPLPAIIEKAITKLESKLEAKRKTIESFDWSDIY